ncbi:aldo/keto reductase [Gloeobacter violaceus]|uniref:Gll1617 protein n=1 Tax=Gloeobacter violaceus (strain ATCC 29082 / PCC 7421) TaxID=251221 RepID=Q7NK63_GLOVI|nr:aldo/keto reductase [Gloeobacter violaceus]BAC89558.1 gll1617 [Gloeobacter violaceus PCC 7421]
METRRLGTNGPHITTIGFGAWAVDGPWQFGWGPVDDRESAAAIRAALDAGVNWIDTAAVYGFGHSEKIVGEAVKGRRDEVFIATKCGLLGGETKSPVRSLRPKSITAEADASLRRLGVDHIDLYQFHWPDVNTPVEDSWGAMVELVEAGKVRYAGVSNFDVPLLEKILPIHPVTSLQPPYSLIKRGIEAELVPFCREHGIGIVVYSPMQAGLLTGKFDPDRLAPDDWRRRAAWFAPENLDRNLALVEHLRPIAARYGKSVGQLAIAWVLRDTAVTSAIVGARRPDQVRENVEASGFHLGEADLAEIEAILATQS